jgi:hypothetical protein
LVNSGLGEELVSLLQKALESAHREGRSATVALRFRCSTNSESGRTEARATIAATWPTSELESHQQKLPSVLVCAADSVDPGQTRIEDLSEGQE